MTIKCLKMLILLKNKKRLYKITIEIMTSLKISIEIIISKEHKKYIIEAK